MADVVVEHNDIYGTGVNLAARIASLAGPGEIVVSSQVRDQLVEGLDADVEDLGHCYVKLMPEAAAGVPRRRGRHRRARPCRRPRWTRCARASR